MLFLQNSPSIRFLKNFFIVSKMRAFSISELVCPIPLRTSLLQTHPISISFYFIKFLLFGFFLSLCGHMLQKKSIYVMLVFFVFGNVYCSIPFPFSFFQIGECFLMHRKKCSKTSSQLQFTTASWVMSHDIRLSALFNHLYSV